MTVLATILVVGVLGMIAAVVAGMRLVRVNREQSVAHEAARAMIERMQATPFQRIFATFNSSPADDPNGAGTAPGAGFAVQSLTPRRNDADGLAGRILFPTTTVGGNLVLSENVQDARWEMPRDLNGDGATTGGAMPGRYLILPVRVRVEWRGASGNSTLDLDHVFLAH